MLIQRPWTRQPQSRVVVDARWRLRPAAVWIGSQPAVDHGNGNLWVVDQALASDYRGFGRGIVPSASFPITRAGASTAAEQAFTFAGYVHIGAGSADHMVFSTTLTTGGFNLYGAGGSGTVLTISKRGVADISNPLTIAQNTTYALIASHRTDTGETYILALPINGGSQLSTTATQTQAALAGDGTLCIGSSGASLSWVGSIGMAVASFNFLPEQAARALLPNLWALFAPLPRRMWAPSAATGIPTLSAATVTAITATTATPRVTITF
jgi:hypothetical protein